MNAAVLADSRQLIASSLPEESEHRLATDGKDLSGIAPRAGKLAWSLLCLSGLVVLLVCGCLVCFGTLAMVASVLGEREGAWWPVMTCMVLLYLLAKGCITCWDGACAAFSSRNVG